MAAASPLPLAFPYRRDNENSKMLVLAGDVGGTKANLAIYQTSPDGLLLITTATYPTAHAPSMTGILRQFLREHPGIQPDRMVLGVAGPVFSDHAKITNLPWQIEKEEIGAATGIASVSLINDLEATAYGLAGMEDKDFLILHAGEPATGGNMAILAPGTGLGEAGLFWDGKALHPFATEGGHTGFVARTADDFLLHEFLLQKYAVVSAESVIAGPAVHDIFQFLVQVKNKRPGKEISDSFENRDPSAVIGEAAVSGSDAVCVETMEYFVRYLAHECCDLILKMKATGGMFLGGGIPPKIVPLLRKPAFYRQLLDCDRMQELVRKVPVKVMLNDKAAMIGSGWYAAYGMAD